MCSDLRYTEDNPARQNGGDSYCGADCGVYRWSQTIVDLDIVVPVSGNVLSAAVVDVRLTCNNLAVSVAASPLISSKLSFPVKPCEMYWSLEPGVSVLIHLEKVSERWWESLFEGESKLNLGELELSRPISDLSQDEEMKLQELWWHNLQMTHQHSTDEMM